MDTGELLQEAIRKAEDEGVCQDPHVWELDTTTWRGRLAFYFSILAYKVPTELGRTLEREMKRAVITLFLDKKPEKSALEGALIVPTTAHDKLPN